MLADFIKDLCNFLIMMAALRLAQAKAQGTAWGPALAFFG